MTQKTGAEPQTAQKTGGHSQAGHLRAVENAAWEKLSDPLHWVQRALPCEQLAQLQHKGWQIAQRQALAAQIGRQTGNRQLQRFLSPAQAGRLVQRWPWSQPEVALITDAEDQRQEATPEMSGPEIVQEPLEGGGSRTYTAADEPQRAQLLQDCREDIERAAGLAHALEDRNPDDRRLAEMADIYTQFLGLQRAIQAQAPWSAEAETRLRSQLVTLETRQSEMFGDLMAEIQPREANRPVNTYAIEQRLRANIRRLSQRRRLLEQMVNTMQRRRANAEGIQAGMQLLRAVQVLEALQGADLSTLGGEAMGAAGQAGPFVGTSGGTATSVTDIIRSSGLDLRLGLEHAWVVCTVEEQARPSECLLMATEIGENPDGFLNQLASLAEEIEADVTELRALRAGRSAR